VGGAITGSNLTDEPAADARGLSRLVGRYSVTGAPKQYKAMSGIQ
jgi:hypothetical protein